MLSLSMAGLCLWAAAQTGPTTGRETTPWSLTGTSSVAQVAPDAPKKRLGRRLFQKEGRFIARAGASYLSREDFFTSPGLDVELSWYLLEELGIDLISATFYFSELNSTASQLIDTINLVPDAERPLMRLTVGGRYAFAYGKLLVESLESVVHLDLSLYLHAGTFITHEAVNFGADAGLSLQVQAFERLLIFTQVGAVMSYENRENTSFAAGPQGTIGVGLQL